MRGREKGDSNFMRRRRNDEEGRKEDWIKREEGNDDKEGKRKK